MFEKNYVFEFFSHLDICLWLTGQGAKVPNKKNKLKFHSLLIDCIDTLDLVILCRQYIKVFNPYISFQYLLVAV